MTVRPAVALTAFVVLTSLAQPAAARPDAGPTSGVAPHVQGPNPLACPITVVAGRLTRCDYLVAHLPTN